MLQHQQVVSLEERLLTADVDVEVGIGLVQVVERGSRKRRHSRREPTVDAGLFQRGMGEEDENPLHWLPVRGERTGGGLL